MPIMPWDWGGIEDRARRADADLVARAATPYARAADSVRGRLLGASLAANPTRGAAGSREAMIAAAPEMSRLAAAGADATNAARATAVANMAERDRARAESGAGFLGGMLNAGGSMLGTLTGAMGGMGGGPASGSASGGNPLGGLLGAAAPIAGTAMGGPLGGMAGGALGSMLSGPPQQPAAPPPAPATPPPVAGPVAGPMSAPPIATGAPPTHLPGSVGLPAPSGAPMSDEAWRLADEEARRLGARLGY